MLTRHDISAAWSFWWASDGEGHACLLLAAGAASWTAWRLADCWLYSTGAAFAVGVAGLRASSTNNDNSHPKSKSSQKTQMKCQWNSDDGIEWIKYLYCFDLLMRFSAIVSIIYYAWVLTCNICTINKKVRFILTCVSTGLHLSPLHLLSFSSSTSAVKQFRANAIKSCGLH